MEHELEHPSLLTVFPSSQYVVRLLTLIPSPHISVQVSGLETSPPLHSNSISIVQVLDHPSPSIKLLSSHSSSPILNPSPQIGLHTS